MRARDLLLVAVPLLLAVSGCTAPLSAHKAKAPTSHQTAAAAHTSRPTPTPAANPSVTPDAPASTPLGAGERIWADYSQRSLPYRTWWAQLSPQLSDAARAEYVYDDPRNIPAMTLTGKIHLASKAPDQAGYTAEVVVPTSKGDFALDLERHTHHSPWLLYAIRFPPGVQ